MADSCVYLQPLKQQAHIPIENKTRPGSAGLSSGQLRDTGNNGSGWYGAEMGVEERALLRRRIKMKH